MNSLIPFNYNSNQIRIIVKDGEPWFVAKDVCDILEISNSRDAVSRLDEDEKDVAITDTPGGKQNMTIISESGVYALVFTSRKEEAENFKRWVRKEVIPSVRKHGAYMTPETIEKVLLNPDTIIQLATALKEERQRRLALEPKAEAYDAFMDGSNLQTMNDAAKCLGIGRNKLFKFLREEKSCAPTIPLIRITSTGDISKSKKSLSKWATVLSTMRRPLSRQKALTTSIRASPGA